MNCYSRGKYNLGEGYIEGSGEKNHFSEPYRVAFASCTLLDAKNPYGFPCLSALRKAGDFLCGYIKAAGAAEFTISVRHAPGAAGLLSGLETHLTNFKTGGNLNEDQI